MIKHRHIAALGLCTIALAACGDNGQTNITAPAATTGVLFFNEGLGAPGVNFFADGTRLTAVGSSSGKTSTVGTNYGQVAAGGYYTGIAPGQYTLSAHLSDTTGAMISSVSTTLASGKWYSYYQSGPYDATAKKVDAWVIEDPVPATYDYTVANVRLVNAIYNSTPGTLSIVNNDSTIHPKPPAITIGGPVAYKTAGAYVPVPVGTYDVSVSGLGTTGPVTNSVALKAGQYYTITARGDITVTSSKATNYPKVDLQANR